jgi:ankyrin repeat protein
LGPPATSAAWPLPPPPAAAWAPACRAAPSAPPPPHRLAPPPRPAAADLNERNANGDTALLFIAREGHYKYPPKDIPAALLTAGADMEAKDRSGLTALQVSLVAGWQNISELLIKSGASTAGVAAIKPRLTCPDCKRIVAQYNL